MKFKAYLPHKYKVYDFVHRSAVKFLVGSTVVLMAYLGYTVHRYIKVVRPKRLEAYKLKMQEVMAGEQISKEEELLKQQREAEKSLK